ncbi:MAG: V-type ATP synthase subunit D [Candidatus Omnitrophica bacterium]|nr:V-type ATP synthase subunit D [Candidatus Omnitrophota bacterium]
MSKIKYTKNALKSQKDALRRFTRYLPTLTLKKQQLQLEISKTLHAIEGVESEMSRFKSSISGWLSVFGESVPFKSIISVKAFNAKIENIAGIDLPVFAGIDFDIRDYDFMTMPLWVDFGIEAVKKMTELKFRLLLFKKRYTLLADELRVTTQRVNLFEKIKIPESRNNIRKINIVLGDMQTAAVVTGKIAKHKIEAGHEAA